MKGILFFIISIVVHVLGQGITIGVSFRNDKYITSADMGKRCRAWLVDNLDKFPAFTLDQEYFVTLKANEICTIVAEMENREYITADYMESLFPHVKRNAMTQILDSYPTDKNTRFHNYGQVYHRHLEPFTRLPGLRYLELGVFMGDSLRAMRKYFPLAKRLVGIDIDPGVSQLKFEGDNTHVLVGSQADREFLTHVSAMHGPFDVILDDASHDGALTIESFKILFPLLRDGGVYVIEDTAAFRDELGYFHDLVYRGLNSWRKDDDILNGHDHCVDPYKMDRKPTAVDPNDDRVLFSLGEVSFGYSSIIIRKEEKPHWLAKLPSPERDSAAPGWPR
jgi:predicted O-methyltransferase YrrM